MTKYICKDNKPLYPQPTDYNLSYNGDGKVVMDDGCVCSDLTEANASLVDITISFPEDFEYGRYSFVNDEFLLVED